MAVIEASPAGGDASLGASWVGGVSPQPTDDVLLGAASGNITITGAPNWNSLESAEGYKGTLKQSAGIAITLKGKNAAGWTWRWQGGTFTRGSVSTQVTLESSIAGNYKVRGGGQKFGTLKLVGSTSAIVMILEDVVKAGEVKLEGGKIDANGFNQEWEGGFATAVAKTKILNIEGITVKISGTGSVWVIGGSNFTLEGTTSTLEFTDPTVTTKTIKPGELTTYGTIRFTANGGAKLKIEESFTCKGFGYVVGEFGATKKLVFKEGITVTIGEFLTALPEPMGNVLLQSIWESNVAGKPFFIKGTGGIYPGDYLSLKDSHASGGTFYAGSHGTNTSGNEGWIFQTYHAKTLTATQSSTPSFGPTIDSRTLSVTQLSTPTFGPTIDYRKLTATQAQSAVKVASPARALSATQAQAVVRLAGPGRVLSVTQAQAAAKAASAQRTLRVTQPQAVPFGAILPRSLTRTLVLTQAQEANVTSTRARVCTAEQGSSVSRTIAVSRALNATTVSSSAVSKDPTRTLSITQPSAVEMTETTGRTFTETFTAEQGSSATRFAQPDRNLSTTQGQFAAMTHSLARTLRVGQAQHVVLARSPTHSLTLEQASAVSYERRIGKPIPGVQGSATTLRKQIGRTLPLIAQGQEAAVVGKLVITFLPGKLVSTVVWEGATSDTSTGVSSSSTDSVILTSTSESSAETSSVTPDLLIESTVD